MRIFPRTKIRIRQEPSVPLKNWWNHWFALLTRNQISSWGMHKSKLAHEEIISFVVIWQVFEGLFLQNFDNKASKTHPKEPLGVSKDAPSSTKQAHGSLMCIELKLQKVWKTVRKQAFLTVFWSFLNFDSILAQELNSFIRKKIAIFDTSGTPGGPYRFG
jgi:hypothetical protein